MSLVLININQFTLISTDILKNSRIKPETIDFWF